MPTQKHSRCLVEAIHNETTFRRVWKGKQFDNALAAHKVLRHRHQRVVDKAPIGSQKDDIDGSAGNPTDGKDQDGMSTGSSRICTAASKWAHPADVCTGDVKFGLELVGKTALLGPFGKLVLGRDAGQGETGLAKLGARANECRVGLSVDHLVEDPEDLRR